MYVYYTGARPGPDVLPGRGAAGEGAAVHAADVQRTDRLRHRQHASQVPAADFQSQNCVFSPGLFTHSDTFMKQEI